MNKITSTLLDLGIPANQRGFTYIADALDIIAGDEEFMFDTTALYECVAGTRNSTAQRVERAIRHSVESAFNRVDPETLERYFGNSVDMRRGKPTNSAFLATIALRLKEST